MKYLGKYKIPEYAINAIEYGDYSGLSEDEEKMIHEWQTNNFPRCFIVEWSADISYFTTSPAFGLPCMVIDADLYEL